MITAAMEPLLPPTGDAVLEDLSARLIATANRLAGQINPIVREAIGDLVRSMNCYYSNLIEGHDTHPRDIERALASEYSQNAQKRVLQHEARAHIEVQRMIDFRTDLNAPVTSVEYIHWVHREFCSRLPDDLLWVTDPENKQKLHVIPGNNRLVDVVVGRHVPPAASDLGVYLTRFSEAYDGSRLSSVQKIVAVAAAHHRLLWIHPFLDGNGRVARLISHAMLRDAQVGSSLWSVARGLSRRVSDYRAALTDADSVRRGDLDGRGNLSLSALKAFCVFFLESAIDQVEFMQSILQPSELLRRIKLHVDDEISAGILPRGSMGLLREALLAGELERGRSADLTGYQERRARDVLSALLARGLLVSTTPKGPVRLGFPIDVLERWLPNLYPGDVISNQTARTEEPS
jgi:Fic family protein